MNLPTEIYEYILWLSCGPPNLDISNKKKDINEEINYYKSVRKLFDKNNIWYLSNCDKYGMDGIYLNSIIDYNKTPELASKNHEFIHVTKNASDLKLYFKHLRLSIC